MPSVQDSLHDSGIGRAHAVRLADDLPEADARDRVEHGVGDRIGDDCDASDLRGSSRKILDEEPDPPGKQQDEHRLDEVEPEVEAGFVADVDFGGMDRAEHDVAGNSEEEKAST